MITIWYISLENQNLYYKAQGRRRHLCFWYSLSLSSTTAIILLLFKLRAQRNFLRWQLKHVSCIIISNTNDIYRFMIILEVNPPPTHTNIQTTSEISFNSIEINTWRLCLLRTSLVCDVLTNDMRRLSYVYFYGSRFVS